MTFLLFRTFLTILTNRNELMFLVSHVDIQPGQVESEEQMDYHTVGLNYIDGGWSDSSKSFGAYNPSTEKAYGHFPVTHKEEVWRAVDAARSAQQKWRKESRVRRAEYFDRLSQLVLRDQHKLRDIISLETGKSLNEANAEVVEALHMCQLAAGMGRQPYGEVYSSELSTKEAYVVRKPKGVVAIISPWNFPLAIGSFWCAAPALVEGNTVIHKPSELTPLVNHEMAKLYEEVGFPKGVFNLVHGDSTTGAALVRSAVDVILFTGSAEVGQSIRKHCADTHSKTCSIECGSKSATMVFADGDMGLALDVSIASAFKLSGQRCVSSSRLLVERSIFKRFSEEFALRASRLTIGSPFLGPLDMGPMISSEHRDRVLDYNELTETWNSPKPHILLKGQKLDQPGYFLTPHVYESEWETVRYVPYLKEEVFGPHVVLIPFDSLEHAVNIYNDTEYGLALGAVTDDFRKHRVLAQECTTGMLYINGGSIAAESHMPFSSWKKSGYGGSAAATWKAVTHTMAVTVNYEVGKMQFAQGMK